MLINWAHCQLWLSSVTVSRLHFTLFFAALHALLFACLHLLSILFSPTRVGPFPFSKLLTSICHSPLSLPVLLHGFHIPALHQLCHIRSHYFQEKEAFLSIFVLVAFPLCKTITAVARCQPGFVATCKRNCEEHKAVLSCFASFWNNSSFITLVHVGQKRITRTFTPKSALTISNRRCWESWCPAGSIC